MDFVPEKIVFEEAEGALWLPVYTRPLHEFKLCRYLRDNGIPVYLPVVPDFKIHNVTKNGKPYSYKQQVLRPMLRSYLFARLTAEEQRTVWRSNSVNNIWKVPPDGQRSFISELRSLQLMEELALNSKVEFKKEIQVNDQFMIEAPAQFAGTRGYLVEKRKKFHWVVKLEFLGRYINAEIDPSAYQMSKVDS